MSKMDDYRRFHDFCMQFADKARNTEEKAKFLEMAMAFSRLIIEEAEKRKADLSN